MVNSLLAPYEPELGSPLCVRFLDSVSERRSREPGEYYKTPEDLAAWMKSQHLLETGIAVYEGYRLRAIELRDALYQLGSAIAAGKQPDEFSLETFNGELCEALAKLEFTDGQIKLTERDPLERALQLIALSAANLFTSDLRHRLCECQSETCGWLFIDQSKNRTRRWCDMADCGNRAKAKRFKERHKKVVN